MEAVADDDAEDDLPTSVQRTMCCDVQDVHSEPEAIAALSTAFGLASLASLR